MPDFFDEEQQNKIYLNDFVGEDKKYKDVENLAKGYANLSDFSEKLKEEKQKLELELSLLKEKTTSDNFKKDAQDKINSEKETNSDQNFNLTEDQIQILVQNKIEQNKIEQEIKSKKDLCLQKMTNAFETIDNAKEAMKIFAQKNGFAMDDVKELMLKNPDYIINQIINDSKKNINLNNFSQSNKNTEVYNNTERGYSYYYNLKKENPKKYFSKAIQSEIAFLAEKMGSSFYEK